MLLLIDRSLFLLFVMVDVFCFSCRWLLHRMYTGGYAPLVAEIGSLIYIRINEQMNNRIKNVIQAIIAFISWGERTNDPPIHHTQTHNPQCTDDIQPL